MRCCSILTNELAGTLAQGPRKSRKQTMRDTHCNPYAQFFLCEPDCNRSGICEYTTGRMPEIRGVISVYDFSSPRPPIHWRFFSSQTKGKQKMKKILIGALFVLWAGPTFAACSGSVYDEYGYSVIGASVIIKGTMYGAVTDIDGNFTIPECKTRDTLQVSYIGYATREFCVGQTMNGFTVILCEDTESSDPVNTRATPSCIPNIGEGTSCPGGGGDTGGGIPCDKCPHCESMDWTDLNPGYQMRVTASCNTSQCRCTKRIEYRCAPGWYGTTTDGYTGCSRRGCSGTVYFENGDVVTGANVVVKNTTNGVVTDLDGLFYLSGCDVGTELIVTMIGLVRQDVTVTDADRTNMEITMPDDYGEINCDAGYYMDWSTGQSRCIKCPAYGNVAGQIAASNSHNFDNDITYCYIPSGTQINDATGAFEYTSNCRYSE